MKRRSTLLLIVLLVGLGQILVVESLNAETYSLTLAPGEVSVVVAQNDSLKLTSSVAGTGRILEGCGAIGLPFPVTNGQTATFALPQTGRFRGTISDLNGGVLSAINVTVVSTNLGTKAIADQVGSQRSVLVGVKPDNAPISFVSADSTLITVSDQAIAGPSTSFNIKTLRRGSPRILAQIMSPSGVRTIASRTVDEFTLETGALSDTIINVEIGIGQTHLTMRPYVKDIEFDFSMFAHSSTFIGGATNLKVFTTSSFIQRYDPVTSEIVGDYYIQIEMPPRETSYCFRFRPFQDDPVPIGDSGTVNGHGCKADVDELSMCVNDKKPLVLHGAPPATGLHPVKIFRKSGATAGGETAKFTGPDTSPDSTTWAKKFDCSLKDQTAANVFGGDHCETYDVQIEDVLFTSRIQVSDMVTLDLKTSGNIDQPPEYDNPYSLRYAVRLGTPLLGAFPAGPVTGSFGGLNIGNGIELIGSLCPGAPATGWRFKRDIASALYEYKPTDPVPILSPLSTDPNHPLGPPSNNDGPAVDPTDPGADGLADTTPSPSSKIYDSDRPAIGSLETYAPPIGTIAAVRFNANEWIEHNGSLNCMPTRSWHTRLTIKRTVTGWVRVGQNDIGPGHINLGFDAGEANPLR